MVKRSSFSFDRFVTKSRLGDSFLVRRVTTESLASRCDLLEISRFDAYLVIVDPLGTGPTGFSFFPVSLFLVVDFLFCLDIVLRILSFCEALIKMLALPELFCKCKGVVIVLRMFYGAVGITRLAVLDC